MLTHHDKTVENAMNVFKECSDLPVQHWGLKDVGLTVPKMKDLVKAFKDSGKTVILEVVAYPIGRAAHQAVPGNIQPCLCRGERQDSTTGHASTGPGSAVQCSAAL